MRCETVSGAMLKTAKEGSSPLQWGCPFAKLNRWRYLKCLHAGQVKISHLRQAAYLPNHWAGCGCSEAGQVGSGEVRVRGLLAVGCWLLASVSSVTTIEHTQCFSIVFNVYLIHVAVTEGLSCSTMDGRLGATLVCSFQHEYYNAISKPPTSNSSLGPSSSPTAYTRPS